MADITSLTAVLLRASVERSSSAAGLAWEASLGLALAATVCVVLAWLLTWKLGQSGR